MHSFLSRRCAGVFSLLLFLLMSLSACTQSGSTAQMTTIGNSVRISRSNSDFLYRDRGELVREYRLFGINPNPLGANNTDENVQYFGPALLSTHMLIANYVGTAKAEYERAHCEQAAAESGFNVVVIAENEAVQKTLDGLQKERRACARLVGKDLELYDWQLDNKSRGPEIMAKTTLQQAGFNFAAPFLVQEATAIPCD